MTYAADRPVFAVLTAAGSGTRLGSALPKALVPIAGVPMVRLAAEGLLAGGVQGIVVTAPESHLNEFAQALAHLSSQGNTERMPGDSSLKEKSAVDIIPDASDRASLVATSGAAQALMLDAAFPEESRLPSSADTHPHWAVRMVPGGSTRQASVKAGMEALRLVAQDLGTELAPDSLVLVHDAARALTPPAVIRRVCDALRQGSRAVIPALPVVDTLKSIQRSAVHQLVKGRVSSTVDRSTLVAVQTPQGFTWEVLHEAHERGKELLHDEALSATDDAGLVEHMGGSVDIVEGSEEALKVTTPWDLRIAHQLHAEQILTAQRLTR